MACSGSDEPAPTKTTPAASETTATPDQAAVNKAAVSDLVTRYWAARVKAQNSGNDSAGQFKDVARGSFIEGTLKSIRDANEDGVKRKGRPEVTEIEVVVTGDTADIMACLNEDGWPFVKDGKDLGFEKRGNGPWGALATQSGDSWLITDVRLPPEGKKSCA